ncbi:MAG: hypothetical protein H8E44_32225 [Planctomycetes bacterium]|nr:hypothetical protein [Planctomycetota bacterium]MBL7038077.1 hypothetical protein [Pirellulaceae bacterium]
MATPLFCVDLSEDARDYRHTALEPGLPLLDRQHVNFQILRKWLGDYIAEPEWRNEDVVAFYMSEEERGRLEDVDCQPVTRGELEKKFADDLESIRVKIKKIRPESSTEQMVHRILKKNIAEQANDLENSDFDSYFFKCRANNEDWRLIWCCGFQRSDLEPLKAKLWHTPDGDFLGVRPPLQGGRVKKRKRTGLGVLASPWLAIALILLLAAFLAATWPKLVVTPNDLTVPLGSRIEFKVDDHRWYFFKDDVTPRALAQSNDPRIVEFDRHGAVANAMDIGQTYVSFRVGSKIIDALVKVTEAAPPDSLVIEPTDNVKVPIGATRNLKAIGHYADGSKVDLTTQVSWSEQDDSDLLVFGEEDKGLIQGDGVGTTKVFAEYPIPRDDDTYAKTSIGVQVVQAEFTSLRVALQPGTFAVGQSSRVEVFGVDKSGEEHSLTGSSLLSYKVQPTTAADVEGTYLVGATEGSGEVQITYADMAKNAAFTVDGRMLSEDVFLVSPTKIDNAIVHELIPLNVTTGTDEPIKAVTANGEVVDVFRTEDENAGYEVWLAARGLGQTEVTVSQGSKSAVVNVTVVEGSIASMQFNPPVYSLRVGQAETAGLEGTTDKQRLIKVVPDAVVWERQPRVENVQVDKATLRMDPLEATEVVQDMQVRLVSTDLLADATVTVSGGLTSIAMLDEGFGVHPPISRAGTRITDGLLLDPGRGGLIIDEGNPFGLFGEIPKGARVVEHNGIRLDGMSEADLLAYFGNNRIGDGDFIRYMGDDGLLVGSMLGDGGVGALIDFKVLDIAAADVKPESFTAELRLYLRQAGNYRLTDAAFTPLSEWNAHTSDATPLVITPSLARNADDDYELYYERQIADQTKRFQISFNLGRLAQRVVETVDVAPVLNTGPDIIVDPRPDPVIVDDNGGGRKVIRKTTRIRRSGDGASVIRSGGDTVVVSDGGTGTRVVSPSGTGTRVVSAPGSSVAGSPGSGSPSPGSPSPGSPSPGTPSPNSPSPASPSPSPSPASPSPPSPSPSSPSPASPSPAPAKPASPNPKPSPAPASPSPADPKPSPAPASPSPKPQGSDTRAPAAPAKPTPAKPTPASPALAKPTPSGSDTRAPSPFRPRTPAGTEGQPASAYGNPVPAGSGTRTAGTPAAGRITGAAAGAAKTMPPTYTGREPSKTTSKDGDKEKNPLLEALERFRQDRKKLENITGKGRVPVIKSSKDDD